MMVSDDQYGFGYTMGPMTVLVTSHLSLFLAIFVVVGLNGLGNFLARGKDESTRLAGVLITISGLAAALLLRTWIESVIIECVVFMGISIGVVISLRSFLRSFKIASLSRGARDLSYAWWILPALLYLEWLWVALPLYRYDQWTYHLVISKWISLLGTLKGPLAVDHIFFTGGYEYLGLIARLFTSDDAFSQGFLNSFTSLMIGYVAYKIARAESREAGWGRAHATLLGQAFALFVLFSTGDHEGASSAKPDFVLMMFGMTALWGLSRALRSGRGSFLAIGMLIGAGASLKLTWLHMALALIAVSAYVLLKRRVTRDAIAFIVGGMLGASLAVPMLVKNYLFFANPLHPAKNTIWQSNIWSPGLDAYWVRILEKPVGVYGFGENILQTLAWFPQRLTGCLIAAGVLAVFAFRRRTGFRQGFFCDYRLIGVFLVTYVGTWGFFFGHHIAHRFVSGVPMIGMLVVLGLALKWNLSPSRIALAFIAPMLWGGEIEVTAMRVAAAAGKSVAEYHKTFAKGPAALNEDLAVIAEHKKARLGMSAGYDRGAIFSDSIWNYYGPSVFYDATAPVTFTLIEQAGIDPLTGCGRDFIVARDIRYFWLKDQSSWESWPPAITSLIAGSEEIAIPHGKLWYVRDPAALRCPT